jgi:hypothetical protein
LTGKETFDRIISNVASLGITEQEIAERTGFTSVDAFRQFWHQRPANELLEQSSKPTRRASRQEDPQTISESTEPSVTATHDPN